MSNKRLIIIIICIYLISRETNAVSTDDESEHIIESVLMIDLYMATIARSNPNDEAALLYRSHKTNTDSSFAKSFSDLLMAIMGIDMEK